MGKFRLVFLVTIFTTTLFAKEFMSIGTGAMTGTYYPVGGALCRIINVDKNYKCSVQATGGSVYNVNNILRKEMDFGFVQSDVVYDKYYGLGNFKGKGNQNFRAVAAVYPELLAFVVSESSGIKSYNDLTGKNINLGNPGSGNEGAGLIVFEAYDFNPKDLSSRGVLAAGETPHALTDKKIDGYFYMIGHPTANITDVANSTHVRLISIDDDKMDSIIEKYPYYAKGTIPAELYEGIEGDTQTIGVKAVLVTNKDQSDGSVEAVIKSILDHFEDFKKLHPSLKNAEPSWLIDGISIPLHPRAQELYEQYGIIKKD